MFFRREDRNLSKIEKDAIDFLVEENFANSEQKPTLEELNDFRLFLIKLTSTGLHRQYFHALAGQLFASNEYRVDTQLCNADLMDLDYYCKMPRWNAQWAINISFNKDPEHEEPTTGYRVHDRVAPYIKKHNRRLQLLLESIKYNEIGEYFSPMEFVIWARKKDIELPEELIKLATKYAPESTPDWEAKYKELELENEILKQEKIERDSEKEKPIHITRESSYHKLIAGIIKLKFSNPEHMNANFIANQLAELDLPFDMRQIDTLRSMIQPSVLLLGLGYGKKNLKPKK